MNLAEIYTDNVFHYLMQFSAVNISAIFLPRFEILNHYTLGKKHPMNGQRPGFWLKRRVLWAFTRILVDLLGCHPGKFLNPFGIFLWCIFSYDMICHYLAVNVVLGPLTWWGWTWLWWATGTSVYPSTGCWCSESFSWTRSLMFS